MTKDGQSQGSFTPTNTHEQSRKMQQAVLSAYQNGHTECFASTIVENYLISGDFAFC